MNPTQLRETTLDPNTRRLVQLIINDDNYQETLAMMDMLLAKNGQKIVEIGYKIKAMR